MKLDDGVVIIMLDACAYVINTGQAPSFRQVTHDELGFHTLVVHDATVAIKVEESSPPVSLTLGDPYRWRQGKFHHLDRGRVQGVIPKEYRIPLAQLRGDVTRVQRHQADGTNLLTMEGIGGYRVTPRYRDRVRYEEDDDWDTQE